MSLHAWTSFNMLGQVWTGLDKSEQAWTSLNMFGQVWTCLDKSEHVHLIQLAHFVNLKICKLEKFDTIDSFDTFIHFLNLNLCSLEKLDTIYTLCKLEKLNKLVKIASLEELIHLIHLIWLNATLVIVRLLNHWKSVLCFLALWA